MKIDIVMPKMGESLQEGTIIKWLKQPGDNIERDEMILEISTDKVDTEVPSPVAGTLVQLLAGENETIEVGKTIAIIETEASAAVVVEQSPTSAAEAPKPAVAIQATASEPQQPTQASSSEGIVDLVMPKMGESLQEGTIIKWLKKPGDKIERDETVLEISTDKVDTEVPSPVAGTLAEILYPENTTVEIGTAIARISTGDALAITPVKVTDIPAPATVTPAPIQQTAIAQPAQKIEGKRFYSPVVKTIAQENNLPIQELETIPGSGLDGRVTKQDILKYLETRRAAPAAVVVKQTEVIAKAPAAVQTAPVSATIATPNFGDDVEIIPMDRVRKLIAEHMVYSKRTSAHVTSVSEADVTDLVKFREKQKIGFEKREGIKLTFTPFFAKAAVDGIRSFPMVNVSVDGTNIIRHRRINLSVATALDDGNLIVPVVKSADAMSLTGLARSITDLATRARTKKLNPDDIQGGTFAMTNVGTFGTLFGTPVINQPQTAIMGIGAIKKRPVVKEVQGDYAIVIRDMVYVSITYDHRVIDGMLAGQCLAAIVKSLESMNENTLTF